MPNIAFFIIQKLKITTSALLWNLAMLQLWLFAAEQKKIKEAHGQSRPCRLNIASSSASCCCCNQNEEASFNDTCAKLDQKDFTAVVDLSWGGWIDIKVGSEFKVEN